MPIYIFAILVLIALSIAGIGAFIAKIMPEKTAIKLIRWVVR